jgi:tetratricopeptide (TPR) repeat protein
MRSLAAAALLVLSPFAITATLTGIPAIWADRVAPIPPQRLDELEPATAGRIRDTRGWLDELLGGPDTDPIELASAFGRLGALYAAHRMYAGAELAFRNARALEPHGFQWTYYAAHIALEQGEAQQALDLLDVAVRIDPAYTTLPLRRGEALAALNRREEARAAYQQLVDVDGLRAAALYGLAKLDLLERDWAAAEARLREVAALQPQADAVQYPLGQALIGLGRRDEARAHLARRGEVKPTYLDPLASELRSLQLGARFRFEEGLSAIKRNDYAAAAAAFAAGLSEEPANARARTSYARALWISGRRDEARVELRRAISDGPAETLPRFLLAVVQDAEGNADAAVTGYQAVLDIDAGHAGALSYLANLRLRQGAYADATRYFERAIAAGVTEMPLYLHYWAALLRAGVDDALLRDRLIEFDQRFPEPPLFRALLAKLLATSSEPEVVDVEFAEEIATALQAASSNPLHTELLALVHAAAGEFERAQALQENLIEMAQTIGAWMLVGSLERTAEAYRADRLPEPLWPVYDPLLTPAPPDPGSAMRNYPAGQPY